MPFKICIRRYHHQGLLPTGYAAHPLFQVTGPWSGMQNCSNTCFKDEDSWSTSQSHWFYGSKKVTCSEWAQVFPWLDPHTEALYTGSHHPVCLRNIWWSSSVSNLVLNEEYSHQRFPTAFSLMGPSGEVSLFPVQSPDAYHTHLETESYNKTYFSFSNS